MDRFLVMTVLGPDRPGLVDSLAATVAAHGGNWLESRMCHLGGQFAGLLRVQIPQEKEGALLDALRALEPSGLRILPQADSHKVSSSDSLVALELVGQDRPGIVSQISAVLARNGVNVEELHTEVLSAPMSGEPLFQARIHLRIPEGCDLRLLRSELEKIASDLMVDMIFGRAAS